MNPTRRRTPCGSRITSRPTFEFSLLSRSLAGNPAVNHCPHRMFSVSCPKDKCDARRRSWTSPISTGVVSWSNPTGGGCRAGATSPRPTGARPNGSERTASRTSLSCVPSTATCWTSASTPTSSATRPNAPPCRCSCHRRWSTRWCPGRCRRPRRCTPTRFVATCCRRSPTVTRTGRATPARAATHCTRPRCGRSRG